MGQLTSIHKSRNGYSLKIPQRSVVTKLRKIFDQRDSNPGRLRYAIFKPGIHLAAQLRFFFLYKI